MNEGAPRTVPHCAEPPPDQNRSESSLVRSALGLLRDTSRHFGSPIAGSGARNTSEHTYRHAQMEPGLVDDTHMSFGARTATCVRLCSTWWLCLRTARVEATQRSSVATPSARRRRRTDYRIDDVGILFNTEGTATSERPSASRADHFGPPPVRRNHWNSAEARAAAVPNRAESILPRSELEPLRTSSGPHALRNTCKPLRTTSGSTLVLIASSLKGSLCFVQIPQKHQRIAKSSGTT